MKETNKSNYISRAKSDYGMDFQELWQKSILDKKENDVARAMDDQAEKNFWSDFAYRYDKRQTLMDYAPEVFDKLVGILGEKKSLIEIGCGTGKFTLPMLDHAENVIGIDFSDDMLSVLKAKTDSQKLGLIHSKWEEAEVRPADSVYSINAIYRMWDLRDALLKMDHAAQEKVVIVWTLQNSIFDSLFKQVGLPGLGRKSDYIHLLNVLYEMGIDANLEFMDVTKENCFETREEIFKQFQVEIKGAFPFGDQAAKLLDSQIKKQGENFIFEEKQKIAFIWWKKAFD